MAVSLKLLVDVGVGIAVEQWLQSAGHDVATVRSVDPAMDDTDILAWAVRDQRLVVTMDKDFGELVYRSRQSHAGVLLLRLDDANAAEKVRVVARIFGAHQSRLAGRFSDYHHGRIRIR